MSAILVELPIWRRFNGLPFPVYFYDNLEYLLDEMAVQGKREGAH